MSWVFLFQAGQVSKESVVQDQSARQDLLAAKETKEELDCQVCARL